MGDERVDEKDSPRRIPPFCGQCGYRLQGLLEEGTCPECGTGYDPDEIVIAGWGAGPKESVGNTPPDRFAGVLILSVLGLLLWAIHRLFKHDFGEALILLLWATLFAGIEIFNRLRLHSAADTPCHARLFFKGFGQRNGFGPCNLHPWSTAAAIKLEPKSHGRYRLQITSKTMLTVPLAIEFECTSEQANWLREMIERFSGRTMI